jgi:hypothetical protein
MTAAHAKQQESMQNPATHPCLHPGCCVVLDLARNEILKGILIGPHF